MDKDSHEDVKAGSCWQERGRSNRDQVSSQTSMKGQAKGFSRGRETGLRMDTKGRHTSYIPAMDICCHPESCLPPNSTPGEV